MIWILDDLRPSILVLDFIPELIYFTACLLGVQGNVVEGYDSPFANERGVELKICSDAGIGVVTINKKKVELPGAQKR